MRVGGPEEIRTLDLSDANRTLSQLSYGPMNIASALYTCESKKASKTHKIFCLLKNYYNFIIVLFFSSTKPLFYVTLFESALAKCFL